jgi:hypothetical protein
MKKGPGIAYDKWNISVVICDTDIPSGQPSHRVNLVTYLVIRHESLKGETVTTTNGTNTSLII